MSKILITGATGNIGIELIRFLSQSGHSTKIVAGVRNIEKAKAHFKDYPLLTYSHFDFEDFDTFVEALTDVDTVFLLRPPHISEVDKYFRPLLAKIKEKSINKIVFLSVQGAEKSKVIPHNKIERLIKEFEINYIFIRPSYFMQNLTTTLISDIKSHRKIILPAGKAKFNWIDIENIGEVAAILLLNFERFQNKAIEITGTENLSFPKVTDLINQTIENPIEFNNANPFKFYKIKKKEGMAKEMILVMILLHFLPRFQKEPEITDLYEQLTGKKPTSLNTFIVRERSKFS